LNLPDALERRVHKYDGGRFPFEDGKFDTVWSFQSLEHVNSAEETFAEIARVLKVDGILFGSTSFLEPYHARSTFCYTPYGFKLLCNKYGLELHKIFPSIEGLSLTFRHLFMMLGAGESEWGNWAKMMRGGGAFFEALRERADDSGERHNLAEAMAQICGQFYFVAQKSR
jgi:SAM-dependent methyltransferase